MKSVLGSGRAVQRLHVRLAAGSDSPNEAGRQPKVPQALHQQPGRIAAGAASVLNVSSQVCTPGSMRITYLTALVREPVQIDEEIDGTSCFRGTPAMNSVQLRARAAAFSR